MSAGLTEEQERELCARVSAGDLDRQIARVLECNAKRVGEMRAALGLPLAQVVRRNKRHAAILAALREGRSVEEVARTLRVSVGLARSVWYAERAEADTAARARVRQAKLAETRTPEAVRARIEQRHPGLIADVESGMTGTEIASRHGVSRSLVAQLARAIGLELPTHRVDHERVRAMLATHSDAAIVREVGCGEQTVARIRAAAGVERPSRVRPRGSLPWDADLGIVSDAEIARREGLSLTTVRGRRIRLGIAPFRARVGRIDWARAVRLRAGGASFGRIARVLGCSASTLEAHLAARARMLARAAKRRKR